MFWFYGRESFSNPYLDSYKWIEIMSGENRSYHHGPKTRNKIKNPDLTFSNSTISASSYVRGLGVTMASSLSMKPQSSCMLITKTCYYYIKWICSIWFFTSINQAKSLIQTLIICTVDYYNALLIGLPEYLTQNSEYAATFCTRL